MCMSPRYNDTMEIGQTLGRSAKENQTLVPSVDEGVHLSIRDIMMQEDIFLSGCILDMVPSMNIEGRSHNMGYGKLGKTGLRISRTGLGAE